MPLTRRFAPPSPRKRGEGQRVVALLPACGEKVPEGRMRGCEKYGLGGPGLSRAIVFGPDDEGGCEVVLARENDVKV